MDGLIEPIRAALHPRRYGLKNREGTNRLLLLMQLHANGQDDVLAYAKDIRAWLEANHGHHPFPAAPSPTDAATPLCPDLSQVGPVGSDGGALLGASKRAGRLDTALCDSTPMLRDAFAPSLVGHWSS